MRKELQEERLATKQADYKACKRCQHWRTGEQYASPNKCWCMIYSREDGLQKPKGVIWDGEPCKYFTEYKGDGK